MASHAAQERGKNYTTVFTVMRLDLNADVGESFGAYKLGQDGSLMPAITSANIACGFHAGDPGVMRQTVTLARQHGVAIGAHPGFPDLVGFGRREIRATPREVEDFVVYQIGALAAVATAQGTPPPAREGARCPLQHGRSRRRASRCDCTGHRLSGSRAHPVRAPGLGVDRGRPPRGTAHRARRIRRSCISAVMGRWYRGTSPVR